MSLMKLRGQQLISYGKEAFMLGAGQMYAEQRRKLVLVIDESLMCPTAGIKLCPTAGIKLLWRLCTSSTAWANWMTNNYLKNNSIWDVSATLLDSSTWKLILSSKDLASTNIMKIIGNGCSLWYDPWLPSGRLVDSPGYHTHITATSTWKVSNIIFRE